MSKPFIALLFCTLSILSSPSQAVILWSQPDFGTVTSGGASQFLPVNDFQLVEPSTITRFSVWMSDASDAFGGDGLANGIFTSFSGTLSWYLFADAGGSPGLLIDFGFNAAPTVVDTGVDRTGSFVDDIFRVDGLLSQPVNLNAGTYWFGVREGQRGAAADSSDILWLAGANIVGSGPWIFGDGANIANLIGPFNSDLAFVLEGLQIPEPSSLALVLLGALAFAGVALRRRTV